MPTPIPGASPNLEFFEEAALNARAANQHVALMPTDLAALCRMARGAARLEPDMCALASYGLQSAVPEVSEAARRVLAGRPSLPPLGLAPLALIDDRATCSECSMPEGEGHELLCSRATSSAR